MNESAWHTGGMRRICENPSTKKTCISVIFPTSNPTMAGLGLNVEQDVLMLVIPGINCISKTSICIHLRMKVYSAPFLDAAFSFAN
jgi:hypothetical protein